MMRRLVFTPLFLMMLFSCQQETKQAEKSDSDSVPLVDTMSRDTISQEHKPVLGRRLSIEGDFNGDGLPENLREHYVSMLDFRETYKDYEGVGIEEWYDLIAAKKPYCYLLDEARVLDTFAVSQSMQVRGLTFLQNEGDLNGDGKDEISYVIDWADFSSLNTWHIISFRENGWEEIYSFPIWDWQLLYEDGEEPAQLLTHLEKNRIQVIYRTNEAEMDTMVVELD